ncbi:hypothetical protein DICVIV_00912 [Dictyocaulus viviparus]|uniref:Rad51-like C-terminal domain-containing protein n=1 Tax=Dictyocaulus viviparus TaxID=29172 RepID=A0A0D8Y9J4_DICVI|nr:hypothetical protein DICVIV_00912 [Dictyocaulus viviparus]
MEETAVDALVALGFTLALGTGLQGIDNVLQNDLQYGEISEIIGDSNVGKTQFCYAIAANTLLHSEFGITWIDSNGSFRSHRLVEYIKGRKEISDENLEQMEEYNIRFIIIDNVHEMFDDRIQSENSGRSAIMKTILGRISALTDIGFTVVTTSFYYKENNKNDLKKVWTEQMRGRILIEEDVDDIRTIRSLSSSLNHVQVFDIIIMIYIGWKYLVTSKPFSDYAYWSSRCELE